MRLLIGAVSLVVLVAASPASAQQWLDYVNREYRFAVNFPVQPTERDGVHRSADGRTLTARVFSAAHDGSTYRVTVVTYPTDPNASAEIAHAAALLRPRGKAIYDARGDYDGVPAHDLSLIDARGRQIVASILFHGRRLYIVEGDVSADAAPPIHFQQSIAVTDANGKPLNLEQPRGGGGR